MNTFAKVERDRAREERGRAFIDAAIQKKEGERKARIAANPRKQLPAFGRDLLALRRRGLVPERHPCVGHVVVAVDHWQWARSYSSRLVIAPDSEPELLDFSIVAGLDVTVFWSPEYTDHERFMRIEQAIMTAEPSCLQVFTAFAFARRCYVRRPGGSAAA